jgi:nicotinamidase-related amidase
MSHPPLPNHLPAFTALVLIDLQRAVDDPFWGPRNNPDAEHQVARLLSAWRALGWPIYHIRHDSTEPDSTFRPGQQGNQFKPETAPQPGETVIVKQTTSAFIGTALESMLRTAGHNCLVVVGVSSSNSVEATVRMAGNLGFATFVAEDACFAFDKRDWGGRLRSAQEVHDMSMANLDGEYCAVVRCDTVMSALGYSHQG